jgi:biotin/methionine sulfoxide reductase
MGGISKHKIPGGMQACRDAGVEFINIGPQRSDADPGLQAEWIAPRPNTDTALMMALAHTLVTEGLHDQAFLDRYTVGFDRFRPYLMGDADGVPKSADWAAPICDVSADTIRALARRMAARRTLVLCAAGLQRADHGEQPIWMTIVLAAMLGQIGLPGGGFGLCYGCNGVVGAPLPRFKWPALNQGLNAVQDFIPVARIADLLLSPGETFTYNGRDHTYPDIRLIYWAGGNPFHHHQDLARLADAFRRPDTVIVNELHWTATARHADIVFPATSTVERNDFAITNYDNTITAMKRAIPPVGEARDDYQIFSELTRRLGADERFTEGLDTDGWLRKLYAQAQGRALHAGVTLPEFDDFWEQGSVDIDALPQNFVLFEEFRADPDKDPLPTPSGRIEIFSETVAGFEYADCPGHPVWREPYEWLGATTAQEYPIHLISAQPKTRLHGQLDPGAVAQADRVAGREPITMHPEDAAARGLAEGDTVRVSSPRGTCRAGLRISDDVRPGVAVLRTGAWAGGGTGDPMEDLRQLGNPNVLTRDKGTSGLAQGPTAHTLLVEVVKDNAPEV